jgi:hypothetical protein
LAPDDDNTSAALGTLDDEQRLRSDNTPQSPGEADNVARLRATVALEARIPPLAGEFKKLITDFLIAGQASQTNTFARVVYALLVGIHGGRPLCRAVPVVADARQAGERT